MTRNAQKIMFEIYRDAEYGQLFRVVYFTELSDTNRDREINRAAAGQHLVSGYLDLSYRKEIDAIMSGVLEQMNRGEELTPSEIVIRLRPYLVT